MAVRMPRVLAICAVVVVGSGTIVRAGPFWSPTQIVAFGDSLTDTGNLYAATSGAIPLSPPYFPGRFSNGPVWVEQLADRLGVVAPAPSLLGGTNWAFGYSESGRGTSYQGTPNTLDLVDQYVAVAGNTITGSELFVIMTGSNDVLAALTSGVPLDPAVPADNVGQMVQTLHAAGAKHFLVANLVPIGQTPLVSSLGMGPQVDALCTAVNAELEAELEGLRSLLPTATIQELAMDDLFGAVMADPTAFGITNTTDPALNEITGEVVPNPEEYVFWDGIHPTGKAHAIIGDQAFAVVTPEPTTLALLAVGGLALLRRRRAGPSGSRRPAGEEATSVEGAGG